jgi:CRP/FNR family transcriptional regulator
VSKKNLRQNGLPIITKCEACPLRALERFRDFSPEELEFVIRFKAGERVADGGATIAAEGANLAHLYTVLEGWGFRYKTLENGSRQVLNFLLPGDFVGLQSSMFGELDHSVDALTRMRLCVFERKDVWELFRNHPGLAFDLTWLATQEEKMLGSHLTAVGQKSARGRMAYLLLHLYKRCERRNLAASDRMIVPFSQSHLADLLGLSLVHTNKTLKRLEKDLLLSWNRNVIQFLDRKALMELAEFDDNDEGTRPFI